MTNQRLEDLRAMAEWFIEYNTGDVIYTPILIDPEQLLYLVKKVQRDRQTNRRPRKSR